MQVSDGGGKVLLIAGRWRERALIRAELLEGGYKVTTLPTLPLALRAVESGWLRPALVVLDVTADTQAGPDLVRELVRRLEGTPVVLLVGACDADTFASVREEVSAWLKRPFRVGSVVAVVERLAAGGTGMGW